MKNAEFILRAVNQAYEKLYGMPGAVVETAVEICRDLEKVAAVDPDVAPKVKGLEDAAFQIEDISNDLRSYLETVEVDERRIEGIENTPGIHPEAQKKVWKDHRGHHFVPEKDSTRNCPRSKTYRKASKT